MLKVEIAVEGLGPETEIGEDFCRYKIYFRASLCTELITAKLQNRWNLTETMLNHTNKFAQLWHNLVSDCLILFSRIKELLPITKSEKKTGLGNFACKMYSMC